MKRVIQLINIVFMISIIGCSSTLKQINFTSEPEGAKVVWAGKHRFAQVLNERLMKWVNFKDFECITPCTARFNPIFHPYRIKAVKYGYNDSEWKRFRSIDEKIHFLLSEKPKINLSITTDPPNAKIYWGNNRKNLKFYGKSPIEKSYYGKCWDKRYLKAEKDGYWDSKLVYIENECGDLSLDIDLVLKDSGTFYISSLPSDAKIYLSKGNNELEYSGFNTPSKITLTFDKATRPKEGRFQLRKEGFNNTNVAKVRPNKSVQKLRFILEKTKYSYIKLSSNESDVDIYIDSELRGQISKRPFVKKVSVGKHIISAKKQFFKTNSIKIDLKENEIFQYNFELMKASGWQEEKPGEGRIIQAKGNLVILTEHNDFTVYIEGVKKIPPFELKNIAAGRYKIQIVAPGIDDNMSQTVNDGEDVIIDLDQMFDR